MKRTSLFICMLFCLLLTIESTACYPTSRKQVKVAMAAIPDAKQFTEENSGFFDLLLDVQNRIITVNSGETEASLLGDFYSISEYLISIYNNELQVRVFCDEQQYNRRLVMPLSKYDLFSTEERQLIEDILTELMPDDFPLSIIISLDRIAVHYMQYHRTSLIIENPTVEADIVLNDLISRYEYVVRIDDNWCVRLIKAENN